MCGMRYFDKGQLIVREKLWGARLTKSTMRSALIDFLAQTRFDVALDFTKKLKELLFNLLVHRQ